MSLGAFLGGPTSLPPVLSMPGMAPASAPSPMPMQGQGFAGLFPPSLPAPPGIQPVANPYGTPNPFAGLAAAPTGQPAPNGGAVNPLTGQPIFNAPPALPTPPAPATPAVPAAPAEPALSNADQLAKLFGYENNPIYNWNIRMGAQPFAAMQAAARNVADFDRA